MTRFSFRQTDQWASRASPLVDANVHLVNGHYSRHCLMAFVRLLIRSPLVIA